MSGAAQTTPTDTDLGLAEALALYRRMVLIRRFEEAVQSLFQRGEVHGTTHLYIGQEASAVGICSALGGRPFGVL